MRVENIRKVSAEALLPSSIRGDLQEEKSVAWHSRGELARYREVVRKRKLRLIFGRDVLLKDIPLGASPFRLEVLVEDDQGKVAILQAGKEVFLLSTFGTLRAGEEVYRRFARNGVVSLKGKALYNLRRKTSSRELWEEVARKGLEEWLLKEFLSIEELLGEEE
jgi:hypothetical protein